MKKTILTLFAATALLLSSCMTTGTTSTTNSTRNVLGSVLGAVLSNVLFGGQSGILGSWSYNAPSAAFTTQSTLTNAGGNTTVANMKSSLASNYNAIGINRSNTSFSFLNGNTFTAKVNGIPFNGTYVYNPQNGEIKLKTATETLKGNSSFLFIYIQCNVYCILHVIQSDRSTSIVPSIPCCYPFLNSRRQQFIVFLCTIIQFLILINTLFRNFTQPLRWY